MGSATVLRDTGVPEGNIPNLAYNLPLSDHKDKNDNFLSGARGGPPIVFHKADSKNDESRGLS